MKYSLDEVCRMADDFFQGRSPVHKALENISDALRKAQIPFAVAGGMAVNVHGHHRVTDDVNILLTPEGLQSFKNRWLGLGWLERFPGSRGLKDTVNKVKIDILLAGHFPGDGREGPIAFPDPAEVAEPDADGTPVLRLDTLLELKLASYITAPHRPQDMADAIQLIKKNALPEDYCQQLHPYVHDRFREAWKYAQIEEDY